MINTTIMKKILLLFTSALMIGAFAFSCNPEEKPADPKDQEEQEEQKDTVKPVEKSHAAMLLEFSVSTPDTTIAGRLFAEDKYVALPYDEILLDCTANVVVSDKATVSPDPSSIKDWTGTHSLTVTAEDGTTSNTYQIKAEDPVYKVVMTQLSEKTTTDMGGAVTAYYGGNLHAFCSPTLFADASGAVFDLSLNKVGDLNMDGVGPGEIESLANDEDGVLMAMVGYGDDAWTTAPDEHIYGVVGAQMFAWKDGWDHAPTLIYNNAANCGQYLNVEGRLAGEMHAFAYTDGRTGDHHTWSFHEGSRPSGKEWRFFNTKVLDNRDENYFYASNLNKGLSSGQNVHAIDITMAPKSEPDADGNTYNQPSGGIYVWASAAPPWDVKGDGSKWRLGGTVVYVRNGIDGNDIAMPATLMSSKLVSDQGHAGLQDYGNSDYVGGIKVFRFNGTLYAAIAHVGVQNTYLTVQNVDYYLGIETDKSKQYLQTSIQGLKDIQINIKPSLAYCLDPASGKGHIVAGYLNGGKGDSSDGGYRVYEISQKLVK